MSFCEPRGCSGDLLPKTAWPPTLAVAMVPLVIFAVYAGRLYWLQGIRGDYYAALKAERIAASVSIPAARGDILDRNGVRLSTDRVGIRVTANGISREQATALLSSLGETVTARGDVLCEDISDKTAAILRENPSIYAGLNTELVPIRTYEAGEVAAHILGTVGPVYAEEYEALKAKGYHLTDRVGKSGIEAALEDELRGEDGVRITRADGRVTTQAAVAGLSVELTLDSVLQQRAQAAVTDTMTALQQNTEPLSGQDVKSGSVVLLDVKDGGVLICASCPTYDLSTYSAQYTALANDTRKPLFNRALYGTYPCGSVIKPAVAIAGLTEKRTVACRCDGVYRYYESVGFAPKCMGRHGAVDTVTALQKSCNVYFMELGRLLGIDTLNRYAAAFGLGQKTGIEVGEAQGVLASPDTKNGAWVAGDTCQCAIGQMDERFTPVQLAAYAMALANGGVRYRVHLVRRLLTYDGTVERIYEPDVLSTVSMSDEANRTVREGMEQVVKKGGTAYEAFKGASYTLAAKTGTAQNGSTRSDHGVFIAYAPADQPQVALAVVMENGTSAAATTVARQVLDAYFGE